MPKNEKMPFWDIMEPSEFSLSSIPLYKKKEEEIRQETILQQMFALSTDLSSFFNVRHDNFINFYISNILEFSYLCDWPLKFKEPIKTGKGKKECKVLYALNLLQIQCLAMTLTNQKKFARKHFLLREIKKIENIDLQYIDNQEFVKIDEVESSDLPLVQSILEMHCITPEGIQIWKSKDVTLTFKNELENIFILSDYLADYFKIRHYDFVFRNIYKLQKEGYLPEQIRKAAYLFHAGNHAPMYKEVYLLTRHQVEKIVMDLYGPKARQKKFEILSRLQMIEADVLQDAYQEAKIKASIWDGAEILKELRTQVPNFATKQEICDFLKIRPHILQNFLKKYSHIIKPAILTQEQKELAGIKAKRIHFFNPPTILRIVLWIDSSVSVQLKQRFLGELGLYIRPEYSLETIWKSVLEEVFADLGLHFQYRFDKYIVDAYVEQLNLILECDTDDHKNYDKKSEALREKKILEKYALVRFNSKTRLETLMNAILRVKQNEVIKLYNNHLFCG